MPKTNGTTSQMAGIMVGQYRVEIDLRLHQTSVFYEMDELATYMRGQLNQSWVALDGHLVTSHNWLPITEAIVAELKEMGS